MLKKRSGRLQQLEALQLHLFLTSLKKLQLQKLLVKPKLLKSLLMKKSVNLTARWLESPWMLISKSNKFRVL